MPTVGFCGAYQEETVRSLMKSLNHRDKIWRLYPIVSLSYLYIYSINIAHAPRKPKKQQLYNCITDHYTCTYNSILCCIAPAVATHQLYMRYLNDYPETIGLDIVPPQGISTRDCLFKASCRASSSLKIQDLTRIRIHQYVENKNVLPKMMVSAN